jgi:hypothetical protein
MGKIGDFLVDKVGGDAARYLGSRLKSIIPFAQGGAVRLPPMIPYSLGGRIGRIMGESFCKGGVVRRRSCKLKRKQKRVSKPRRR